MTLLSTQLATAASSQQLEKGGTTKGNGEKTRMLPTNCTLIEITAEIYCRIRERSLRTVTKERNSQYHDYSILFVNLEILCVITKECLLQLRRTSTSNFGARDGVYVLTMKSSRYV